ncbi:hypothetical protein FNZ56_06435 [Pseudoluteimonas lycopersici]|uniref:Uncharacterized protein n=1 Tax=Pseudoluteimonas lycopersici TaxID=1324796 RepID=A0A516V4T4_9GAMM|nr:hypothetical protein [Lysobacter lycopersici]QDQ73534.1 hypothetical protein FNZ56_06435 [Lysobacter lycopersici]
MRNIDLSSWNAALTTLLGLVVVSLVAVGIRLLVMQTIQRRQQAQNRQINERLRTLIAAYKTLGGSFTGELSVDPAHKRDLRRRADESVSVEAAAAADPGIALGEASRTQADDDSAGERRRRIRDAVEAALSDIILLGTAEQVRLAAEAASEMVAGRPVKLAALVVSLRGFIREALDLAPVPAGVVIPEQGPLRTTSSSGGGKRGGEGGDGGNAGGGGGGGGMGGGGMGGAMGAGAGGMGMGLGLGHHAAQGDDQSS